MKREPAILKWNRGFTLVCVLWDAVEGTVTGNDAAQGSVIGMIQRFGAKSWGGVRRFRLAGWISLARWVDLAGWVGLAG